MAGGKESPRQKMIGMMYLVLTALLALNVSKEILNSFIVVNQGLENTNTTFAKKTETLYGEFDFQKSLDPARVAPLWEKAQQAKKYSSELYAYIEGLKKRLLMETEDIDKGVADTLQLASVSAKDNYDVPTYIMIGESEDGSKGVARELKQKLDEYKSKLMGLVDKDAQSSLQIPINTSNLGTGGNETWEMHNFFHTPLAASITILSKLQNDVKNSETEVVSYLLSNVDSDALKFDTVTAKVIPQSNYVLLGEDYKADVFIAAYSKTQKPQILAGDYDMQKKAFNGKADSLPVEAGQGKYTMRASREGFVKWGGTISIKSPKGKTLTYPFESEFIVARPALTVSADKMNVLYAGVANPISISVPGIPTERLTPTISSGSLRPLGNGKYEVTGVSGTAASVSVVATMENGEKRSMGKIDFRVKPLPQPNATFAGVAGGKLKEGIVKSAQGIAVKGDPGFVFDVQYRIVSFNMEVKSKNQIAPGGRSNSGYLTDAQKNLIQTLKKYDVIYFTDIKAADPSGKVHSLPEISITLM